MKKLTQEEFLQRAIAKHGNHYDYSEARYVSSTAPVTIICPIHGPFQTLPKRFLLQGTNNGCYVCGREKVLSHCSSLSYSTQQFIERAKSKFGCAHSYEKTVYSKSSCKVTITCSVHGDFTRVAANYLLSEHGCPACGKEKTAYSVQARKITKEEFVLRSIEKYGDRFDLSKVTMSTVMAEVVIGCPIHGDFVSTPNRFLSKSNYYGCPSCGNLAGAAKTGDTRRWTTEEFVSRASAMHNGAYDYSNVVYSGKDDKIEIICKEHGSFLQSPATHLKGSGCQKCSHNYRSSKEEAALYDFIKSNYPGEILQNDRRIIAPLELDIVAGPLAIEYCGLYWHSEANGTGKNYHLAKLHAASKANIKLITIFSDEWKERQTVVKSIIARELGASKGLSIGARNTTVFSATSEYANKFYEEFHLQGGVRGGVSVALTYNGEPVVVATVGPKRVIFGGSKPEDEFELYRYCVNPDYAVQGALERVCSWVKKNTKATSLVSYVDRRWFTGSSYAKAGFELVSTSPPGYWYVKGDRRVSRYSFAKHKLSKKLGMYDPGLTEKENAERNGWNRVYDCGQLKFVKLL